MIRSFFVLLGHTAICTILCMGVMSIAGAQVMSSTNYQIQSDSVNVGGGNSTSTNYGLESTTGEIATGNSSSTNYSLRAGYQQMQEVFLSLSAAADVTLLPALGGLTGGVSSGTTAVLVTTDSPSGYQLMIQASGTPAMRSGANSIANYTPVGAVPDFTFITDPSDVQFGFSPEGVDIVTRYQDSASACGVAGSDTANRCWDGLSVTPVVVAQKSGSNHPLGATTTLKFQVGIGGSIGVAPGTYAATTTLTALPL
jgi:hypothetical protein